MARLVDQWSSLWPALAFLLAGVPLAELLGKLGFFDSLAVVMLRRDRRRHSLLGLWVLAALTTAVLNLDTTIVLLTPLCLRLARHSGVDRLPVAAIPLLLASFASSVLPISNLTTLIVVQRFHVGALDVMSHLALPSITASVVGWLIYRRRHPITIGADVDEVVDRRALVIGGVVVAGLLIGFLFGPQVGIDAWVVALAADVVLVLVVGTLPWRDVPVGTAVLVAAVAAVMALIVPTTALNAALSQSDPAHLGVVAIVAGALANAVNNLPALLAGADSVDHMTWGTWAWLLGVNVAAVLLPIGALANLLWLRIMRAEGLRVGVRTYLKITVPVALPATAAAIAVLVCERAIQR